MKKVVKKIGVLDMNIDNIYLLNKLREVFKSDDIYYINDTEIETFDEMDVKDIHAHVSSNINYLLSKEVDVIVVSAIYYFEDILEKIGNKVKCPIVSLKDVLSEVQ